MEFIATLPSWLIGALFCGAVGGIGAVIGGALQKRGHQWGRFVPILGIVVAVALSSGLVDWIRGATLNEETSARMLVETSPAFYGYLQENFPEDFDVLVGDITAILKQGGTGATVGQRSAEAVAQIRRKYAPMVAQAADADHAAIINSLIEFYSALDAEGTELCNAVAIDGPVALLGRPDTEQFVQMMEPQAVLAMQAAKSGIEAPVQRRATTDEDWATTLDATAARGASQGELDAITTLDPASPDLCPGLVKLLQTLNGEDTEAVRAVRAQYVADLTAA